MEQTKCKECGNTFMPARAEQFVCSIQCRNKRAGRASKYTPIPCRACGKVFKPRDAQNKYCSVQCRADAHKMKPRPCQHCGQMFTPKRSNKTRFCSKKCGNLSRRLKPRPCEMCGKVYTPERYRSQRFCTRACRAKWVGIHKRKPGGIRTVHGYTMLYRPEHPMATKAGYVMEHRLVMAEHLGRTLTADEVVHHRNGNKADNRVENLEVVQKRDHDSLPKPPKKPITCPHCGGTIITSGRVRFVEPG